jgi:hypothetical protein
MMKKHYLQPAVQVIMIETEGMLASSPNYSPIKPDEQGTPATKEYDGGWNTNQWSDEA